MQWTWNAKAEKNVWSQFFVLWPVYCDDIHRVVWLEYAWKLKTKMYLDKRTNEYRHTAFRKTEGV